MNGKEEKFGKIWSKKLKEIGQETIKPHLII